MPRLGSMIVDGLAFVLVGIALTAVVVGYARNLPDPIASRAQSAEGAPTWGDPVTTGSIAPARPGTVTHWAEVRPWLMTSDAGRPRHAAAWVDPPRR
ncbi:hypothetical protein ACRBEV_00155 [Methylobacterium phyllosphaerae]